MSTKDYYTIPEEEIQELLEKAKAGDQRVQAQLLQKFEPFLSKYVSLLYYGVYDVNNYDMRKFISLFIKDPVVRFHLLRNKLNDGGRRHVAEVMQRIQGMARRYGDESDVRQTVQMTFLYCISIYKRKESKRGGWVPFSGFIYSYFYYLLKRNVDTFLIDQLGRKTFPLQDQDMMSDDIEEFYPGFPAPPEPSPEETLGPDEIDEYWVLGDTAYPPFDALSIQERQLLKWRYVDGMRASDIARKVTEHPNTVREHFNRLREKIKDSFDADMEMW